jgi:hypothetical protein
VQLLLHAMVQDICSITVHLLQSVVRVMYFINGLQCPIAITHGRD